MTAPDRAEVIDTLQLVVDLLRANPSVPAPVIGRQYCPVTFYAHDSAEPQGPLAIAESLGVTGAECKERAEEDGWPYLEVTGMLGGLHVVIAADDGPVLLDPLTDQGAVIRSYETAGGVR